jgi:putative tryptophan/tyrosine transport system substrate-binding protein
MTQSIKRRQFIALLGGAAAAWPGTARAQQPNAVKRIGWLTTAAENDPEMQSIYTAFPQEMQRLGWTIGRNLQIDHRSGAGDVARIQSEAVNLVAKSPDLIVSQGTLTTAILKPLTSAIPIVFVSVADPVASGFVTSFARPGGNLTGFVSVEHSLAGKWVSILRDVAPSVNRVLVLYSPENSNWTGYMPNIEAAGRSLRMNVSTAPVMSAEDFERAIEAFAREPAGGIVVLPGSPPTITHRETLLALIARHRLPAIYPFDYFTESGGLVSYGPENRDLFRRAAAYVDRILKGEKPSDLPVQAPVKFELVINLKAAKAVGIEVPYNVLLLADRVID